MKRLLSTLITLTALPMVLGCSGQDTEESPGTASGAPEGAITAGDAPGTTEAVLVEVDLLPVEPFCERTQEGGLVVNVRNQGNSEVTASVLVEFDFSDQSPTGSTEAIPAGEVRQAEVNIPQGVPAGDFDIRIVVQRSGLDQSETNKSNNIVEAHCIS